MWLHKLNSQYDSTNNSSTFSPFPTTLIHLKRWVLLLILGLTTSLSINGQSCFTELADFSGFDTSPYQDSLNAWACQIKDVLPAELQDDFQVFDFGFYTHTESYEGEFPEMFDKAIAAAAAESPYYLLFGKQSDKNGVYTKFWVDFKLPEGGVFECFDAELHAKVQAQLKAILDKHNGSPYSYASMEKEAMEFFVWTISQIIECECNLLKNNVSCELCTPTVFIGPVLEGNGFAVRKVKNVQFTGYANIENSHNIIDSLGSSFEFETDGSLLYGETINLVEELSPAKAEFDALVSDAGHVLNGKVYLLTESAYCNAQQQIEDEYTYGEYHYIEVHIIVNEGTQTYPDYYLYSKVYLEGDSNTEGQNKAILPMKVLVKFGKNALIDVVLQVALNRAIHPDVCSWGDAFGKVNYWSAAWSGISSFLPWDKQKKMWAQIAGNVIVNLGAVTANALNDPNYTVEQGMFDFTIGVGVGIIMFKVIPYVVQHGPVIKERVVESLDHWFTSTNNPAISFIVKEVSWEVFKLWKGVGASLKDAYQTSFIVSGIRNNISNLTTLASDLVTNPALIDFLTDNVGRIKAWKGLINQPKWLKLQTDLLESIAGKSDNFIARVDGFYAGLINQLPSNLPQPLPNSMPFNFNGQSIVVHFNKYGFPKFGHHMTPITHDGLNVAKSYKGPWNPVTSSHNAARGQDLRDATKWALKKDAAGNLINFPNGRVRRATTSGGNPSTQKIEILKDGGNPANDADWIKQTWHHHENGVDIIPVPSDIHNHISHSGGFAAKHGPDGSTITPDTDITEIFDYIPEIN